MHGKTKIDTSWEFLLDKKNLSNTTSFIWEKLGVFVFLFVFLWSFLSSIPMKETPLVKKDSFTVVTQDKSAFISPANVFNPDLVVAYILNYKTTQIIAKNSFKEYLELENTLIDFDSFSKNSLDYQLNPGDLMTDINHIKHAMIEEDLSIVPFKSGSVSIDSEIISTTQSQNYYMVEVLKTFKQGKKVVKVLEKKLFNLKSLESGHISYYKNVIFNSSKITEN